MIRPPVQDMGGGQAEPVGLLTEVLRDRSHSRPPFESDTSFHFRH